MEITLEVDYDGLVRDLLRAKAYNTESHRAATLVLAETFVEFIDDYMAEHHDTNRYINGWIKALLATGSRAVRKKAYKKSSRHEAYVEKLTAQHESAVRLLDQHEKGIAQYEQWDQSAPPRKDGKPRKKRMDQPHAQRKLERIRELKKEVRRTERELRRALGSESILFFDRRANERGKRENHTVRDKIYGGDGRMFTIGDQLFVELANQEPHARLVEAHPKLGHPVKAAFAALRHIGIRRASRSYMNKMAERFGPPKPTDALSVVRDNEIMAGSRAA